MPSGVGFKGSTKESSGLGMLRKETPGSDACCSFRVTREEKWDC